MNGIKPFRKICVLTGISLFITCSRKMAKAAISRMSVSRIYCSTTARKQSTIMRSDRKSVVWGKSVSYRVDLGGSRYMKKTKKKTTSEQQKTETIQYKNQRK